MIRFTRIFLVLPIVYILYFHGMNRVGMLSSDEPRYASIGREMARSGDWITPRLWGVPWFEKPALLYWMTGAASRMGLPDDVAPRLPVALLSAGFLAVYFLLLREQVQCRAAAFATAILGTSALWLAYSRIAVTDLPVTVFFSAAMLLSLEWLQGGGTRRLPYAGICLGLAVLAKGLAPLVLCVPLFLMGLRRWFDLWRVAAVTILVAAPWYLLCAWQNGAGFLMDFFVKHHFGRFVNNDLQHAQPFWYYVPVLLGAVFPWTPLLACLRKPEDRLQRFLWLWVLFGLAFFSMAVNKLPGYMLPLLPAMCALLGMALAKAPRGEVLIGVCAALIGIIPAILPALPEAIASGVTRAFPLVAWGHAIPMVVGIGGLVWLMALRRGRGAAVALVVCVVAGAAFRVVQETFPVLDRQVSARGSWRGVKDRISEVCLEDPHRAFRYGMNYYTAAPLPDCEGSGKAIRLRDPER